MANEQDHYKVLGIKPDATDAEIRAARALMVQTVHLDRLGLHASAEERAWAQESMIAVNTAYAVLSDPARRREYDARPRPRIDPETLRFQNVGAGEPQTGSFVLYNDGGDAKELTQQDPVVPWVKITDVEPLIEGQSTPLPLRIFVQAVGQASGTTYKATLTVRLDNQEAQCVVELDTQLATATRTQTSRSTSTSTGTGRPSRSGSQASSSGTRTSRSSSTPPGSGRQASTGGSRSTTTGPRPSGSSSPPPRPPILRITPSSFNFDDVDPGDFRRGSFVVTNGGGPYPNPASFRTHAPWLEVTSVRPVNQSQPSQFPAEVTFKAVAGGWGQVRHGDIAVGLGTSLAECSVRLRTKSAPPRPSPPPAPPPPPIQRLTVPSVLLGALLGLALCLGWAAGIMAANLSVGVNPLQGPAGQSLDYLVLVLFFWAAPALVIIFLLLLMRRRVSWKGVLVSGPISGILGVSALVALAMFASWSSGPAPPAQTAGPPEQAAVPVVATPEPAGRIVFTSNRDGNYEIYVMDGDGSNQTRLTDNLTDDFEPAWSPDGSRIAFAAQNADSKGSIYVINADGSNRTRLTTSFDNWHPAWSPDGRRIAYASRPGAGFLTDRFDIYVMDADGSNKVRLTDNWANEYHPSWSPDGRSIVFTSGSSFSDSGIYMMLADGSEQFRVTGRSNGDVWPAWSPDGRSIAVSSERDGGRAIYVINITPDGTPDGFDKERLTHGSLDPRAAPAWSPDGRRIAYAAGPDGNLDIWVMNSDGTGKTWLTDNTSNDHGPDWTSGKAAAPLTAAVTPSATPVTPPTRTPPATPVPTAVPAGVVPSDPSTVEDTPKYGTSPSCLTYQSAYTFDVHRSSSASSLIWASPLYNGLIEFNPETHDVFDIRGDLATSWEMTSDGLGYIFNLNPNAKWWDGKPITAEDVVWSLDRMTDSNESRPWTGRISPYYRHSEALDSHMVEVNTNFVSAALENYLASDFVKILPKHVYAAAPDGRGMDAGEWKSVLGSGPFRLDDYEKHGSGQFSRNQDYWKVDREGRRLPYLDGFNSYVIKDGNSAAAALRAGQVEFTCGGSPTKVRRSLLEAVQDMGGDLALMKEGKLEAGGGLNVYLDAPSGFYGLWLNTGRKPFDDARVRRAIHLAIDRDKIIENTHPTGFALLGSPMPPNTWFGRSEVEVRQLPGFRHPKDADSAEAARLMKEVGYGPDSPFNGVFHVPNVGTFPEQAIVIANQLRKIGLQLEVTVWDISSFLKAFKDGEVDMAFYGDSIGVLDPDAVINRLYVPREGDTGYRYGFPIHEPGTTIVGLNNQLTGELDRAKRADIIRQFEDLLLDKSESSWIGVMWRGSARFTLHRIKNFHRAQNPFTELKNEHIWVDPG